jgi:fructose-1,6-bisphosphatase I
MQIEAPAGRPLMRTTPTAAVACKSITASVRRAGLKNLLGYAGSENSTGDSQKKLDIISNQIFCSVVRATGTVALMCSEEDEEPIIVSECTGPYVACFDPLDGSSNIDCNVSVGTIFGLYRRSADRIGKVATADELYRPGKELVCAGYAAYGSSTQLVIAFNDGRPPTIFTLDPTIGEFIMSQAALTIPSKPQTIYSVNEGNILGFPLFVQKWLDEVKLGSKPYSSRYVGSMVADVHRTLLYGGVFIYPSTASSPAGKLRLLYEGSPMAFICEAAGGRADTGLGKGGEAARVLDVVPTKPHERVPIILGCKRDVDALLQCRRVIELLDSAEEGAKGADRHGAPGSETRGTRPAGARVSPS